MAERGRFELPEPLRVQRFSRPPLSTAQPPLQLVPHSNTGFIGMRVSICYLLPDFMDLLHNFEFPWPSVNVVLEGGSILDVPRLQIKSMEEATEFIKAYGFDVNDPDDLVLVWRFFHEAVQFIEKTLACPGYSKVPEHLRSQKVINDMINKNETINII